MEWLRLLFCSILCQSQSISSLAVSSGSLKEGSRQWEGGGYPLGLCCGAQDFSQPCCVPLQVVIDKHPVRFFVHKRPHVDFFLEVVSLQKLKAAL